MSGSGEIDNHLEELPVLHDAIIAYCFPSFTEDLRSLTLGLLPRTLRQRFVAPERDPWNAPEEVGHRLAGLIGLAGESEQILMMGFATRVHQTKITTIKAGFLLRSDPPRSLQRREYPTDINQLIGLGERLASNFTLRDLTAEHAQFLLSRAAIDVSQLTKEG